MEERIGEMARRRLGLFGGTFDPVHLGHLILAEQAREQGGLDEVWFVPAARPPHKQERVVTPVRQRVEMLELAVAGHAAFRVDDLESRRQGPSYTVDTLAELHARVPGSDWFLLLGSDSVLELPDWHDPAGIVRQAGLVVMARPGSRVPGEEDVRSRIPGVRPGELRLQVVHAPLIDISSKDLRARAAAGHSLRYQVPRAVECYIQEKSLYRPSDRPSSGPAGGPRG